MVRSVAVAGGGTGGHIEPAMALADALRRIDPAVRITCLGTERGLETKVIPARGYALDLIPAVPLPRSLTPDLLRVPGRLAGAVRAASDVLDRAEASVLAGFGGYVATPGYLAARRRRVPIVVHEANPRPGLANRIGARLTGHVFVGQAGTLLPHAHYVGIPIRTEIARLDRLALSDTARSHFGLRPDLPVLLVTGGSQGAASLNRAVLGASRDILAAGVQVLHIVGPRSGQTMSVPRSDVPYVTVEYLDRMDLAYAAADFALCRAGAMTCAELTAVGLPAAYVPLPHGNGEQRLNALPVERAGGGLIIDDASLSPDWIRSVLLGILLDHELVASMSRAASSIGNRDADVRLARQVLAIADGAVTDGARVHGAAAHGTAADRLLPGMAMPDRAVPDRAMPDRAMPDRAMRDRAVHEKAMRDRAADDSGWRAADGHGAAEDETTEGGAGRNGRHRGSHRGRGQ
jgi:UDP-N-acetylglucosamine--N-acetylmuramyl-(pentapeptide) pyrophosphoryl-undecaprenol N-acetylglucosamine transferase